MKINEAEIVISAVSKKQYPDGHLPEIAMAGRSNVGKSSFINRMIGRKNLVRTSSKPGKTRTLNFYLMNQAFYFVDVPGYGYAKVSKTERDKWGTMLAEYFQTRENLEAVVLIIDIRHKPTKEDMQMVEFVVELEIPLIIIATKYDKIKPSKRHAAVKDVQKAFDFYENLTIVPFSAETGENKDKVWSILKNFI